MNPFWNLFALLVLLAMALWLSKGAVRSVGIFRVSRAVINRDAALHECDDPDCPATTLFSAIEDTHRKVRTEAVVAVAMLVAVVCTFVFFMGRLV
jgi:succinate dehydrogenase hydrophobic anchor subunit